MIGGRLAPVYKSSFISYARQRRRLLSLKISKLWIFFSENFGIFDKNERCLKMLFDFQKYNQGSKIGEIVYEF